MATDQNEGRFDDFQTISDTHQLTLGVGMPTTSGTDILISMLIFQSNRPRQTYSKQHLHQDELPYFVGGQQQVFLINDNTEGILLFDTATEKVIQQTI